MDMFTRFGPGKERLEEIEKTQEKYWNNYPSILEQNVKRNELLCKRIKKVTDAGRIYC